jgi:hypothetical protein
VDGGAHVRPLRPDHLDPHAGVLHRLREVAAQRRPRLVGVPAGLEQQIPDTCARRRFNVGLPGRQDAALRLGHVLDQLQRQLLVLLSVRRGRQPHQIGSVQQPDGENPAVPAPGPDRRGRRLSTGPPEPAQIPRMQLQWRLVVLPFPERAYGLAQPVDSRRAQNNRHSPESHTTAPTVRTRFLRPAGTAGLLTGPESLERVFKSFDHMF